MPYAWLVFLHVTSVVGFVLAHGASAAMGLRLRRETSPDSIRSLVVLSTLSTRVMYPFLVLVLLTGIAAGFAQDWWRFKWIWTAIIVLVVTTIVISAEPAAQPASRRTQAASLPRPGGGDTRCEPQGGREHAARPDQRRGRGRLRHPGLADDRQAVLGAGLFDSRVESAVKYPFAPENRATSSHAHHFTADPI